MSIRSYLRHFFAAATIDHIESDATRSQGVVAYGPRRDALELHHFLTSEPVPQVNVVYASGRETPSMLFSRYIHTA